MHFTQVDTCHVAYWKWAIGSLLLVGGYCLILLRARPVDNHRLRQFPGPIEDQWFVATAIGKPKHARFPHHRRAFVLDTEVPLTPPWWMCRWISSPPLSPTLERSKEGLYTRIGSMGMQLLGGEEPHEMLGLKPETFVPHCPPEEDERLAIEYAAFMRQLIELGGLADMHASDVIHAVFPPQ